MSSKKQLLKNLGKRISEERKKRGITLEKLAYEMEISKGNLSDIENGLKDPRFSTLKLIAKGLNISISALLQNL